MAKSKEEKADALMWKLRRWGLPGTKKRAAAEFQKMIRYESANLETGMVTCVTCGFSNHWKNSDNKMHAGHYIGGRSHALLFQEETDEVACNCHPQCAQCNDTNKKSGNLSSYTPWMIERYGEARVEQLRKLQFAKVANVKYTKEELDDMRLEYKRRSKIAEKRLIELGV